jgi:hypothetical protein
MPLTPRTSNQTVFTSLQVSPASESINSIVVFPVLCDGNGDILIATGLTKPTDTSTGYAKGCLFIDTDVASGTTGLLCNKGTNTSCIFTAVTQA